MNAYGSGIEKVGTQQAVANADGSGGSRTPDYLVKSQIILRYNQGFNWSCLVFLLSIDIDASCKPSAKIHTKVYDCKKYSR